MMNTEKYRESNSNKTLVPFTATDLARLAIPKQADLDKILGSFTMKSIASQVVPGLDDIDKIVKSSRLISPSEILSPKLLETIASQQLKISGIATWMGEIAKELQMHHKPEIEAFQSIAQKIQPLIIQPTRWSDELTKSALQLSMPLEAVKTLSAFNDFQRYRETFEEFGGGIDPDQVTEVEIEQTIEENRELILEVNELVLQRELDGVSPGDTHALIFSYLVKRVPSLKKSTYKIIVLIVTTAVIYYELHSDYSTSKTLNESVVPALEQHSEKLEKFSDDQVDIKETISKTSKDVKEIQDKTDSRRAVVDELIEATDAHQVQTQDKLDLILELMRKQDHENNEH